VPRQTDSKAILASHFFLPGQALLLDGVSAHQGDCFGSKSQRRYSVRPGPETSIAVHPEGIDTGNYITICLEWQGGPERRGLSWTPGRRYIAQSSDHTGPGPILEVSI